MQTLKLADDLFPSLESGDKKVTVRRGRRDIQLAPLEFESVSGDIDPVEVEVVEVRHLRLSGINEEVCHLDNYGSWVELYETMKKFYPDIDVTEECTIIFFE